jgi:hypothetical protein
MSERSSRSRVYAWSVISRWVTWFRLQLGTVKADSHPASQGITRMLLTSIPYFREVIIMSFRCDHCGNSNTEIQSAGEIQREPFSPVL